MGTNSNTSWAETPAGKHLQESLSNQKTLSSIDRLLNRIDTLENAVEKLTIVMEQSPGMLSMAADVADETYRNAAKNGVDIEQRLKSALHLAEQLTSPAMMEKLESFISFTHQTPGLISITMDMVDEGIQRSAENGVVIENRLKNALTMAEKLTAPEMVEKLNGLLQLADQAPGLISIAMDSFDEQMGKMARSGIDIQEFVQLGKDASNAMAQAKTMPEAKVGGIFSMLKTMRDPDRQRVIGFLMNIAKAYGQQMKK
ncbi:MAG: DUF1641 domain-containing protein [Saprospiraceae bacterium]